MKTFFFQFSHELLMIQNPHWFLLHFFAQLVKETCHDWSTTIWYLPIIYDTIIIFIMLHIYIYISCIIYVCIKVWKWKKTYIKFCIYMFGQAKLDSDREKLVRMLLRGSWRNNCASLKTIYLAFFFFVFLGWSSFLLKTFYWKCVKLCLYLKKKI